MSFRMIEPEVISDVSLLSTTVPETDADEWSALTDYTTDDEVMVTAGSHSIFRATADSGPGGTGAVDPTTDVAGVAWVNIRSTNRWRVFDEYIGDPTTQADAVDWELRAAGIVDSVALLGLSAASATIVACDAGDVEIYNETHSLQDETGVTDLYEYFFSPIIRFPHLIVTDIPPYYAGKITVAVVDPGDTVEVGQLVIGRQESLGNTLGTVPLGIEDYSRKERDEEFGRYSVVERDFANIMNLTFGFPTSRATYLRSRLAGRRAQLTVFASDSSDRDNDYVTFGFFKSFQVIARVGIISEGTIELESIT